MTWYEHIWGWVGLIFSIVGSTGSILLIIELLNKLVKRKQLRKKLRKMSFSNKFFTNYQETVIELLTLDPNAKNPYKLSDPDFLNKTKACIFNMIKKNLKYIERENKRPEK
jgi:hypothetical protein